MRRPVPGDTRPGNGEHVRVVNPLSGRTWTGPALKWASGAPQLRTFETGEVRWFPPSWVQEVYTPDRLP